MGEMHKSTVRFSRSTWQAIVEEAGAEGVSLAEFIREATIIRAMWLRVRRGDLDMDLERIAEAVERLRD